MTKRLDLKTFRLSEGSIVINDNKDIDLVENVEEVEQSITAALSQNIEAWIFNIVYGVSKKALIKKGASDDEIFEAVRVALDQEERVSRIENFEVIREQRKQTIKLTTVLIDNSTVEVVV